MTLVKDEPLGEKKFWANVLYLEAGNTRKREGAVNC